MRTSRCLLLRATATLLLLAASRLAAAQAGLLFPQDDLRDRLLRARDAGRTAAPLAMWPVTSATARAAGIDGEACDGRIEMHLRASDGERLLLGFADGVPADRRAAAGACLAPSATSALRAQINAERTAGRTRVHADGTYAALDWHGALLTAGAVPRYWGPGWAGSLILGDNARPVPAIGVRRADASRGFESRWLAWLGPWDAEIFFGRLQGHDEPRAPRFVAMRLEAAPASWLTLGASRAIQWGGAGRDNSLGALRDALLGRDNVGASGIGVANEPGNQLAGFDVRISAARLGAPVAVYTQWIGEDEAGYRPSKYIAASGIETWFATRCCRWRASLEHVDTVTGLHDEFPGTAYRHHIYRQGYTQHGRVIGFSLGTDVRAAVLRLDAFGVGPWSGSLRMLDGDANPGAIADLPYAGASRLRAAEARLRYRAAGAFAAELRTGRSQYTPQTSARPIRETTVGASVELRLP
jgi:hypothetical protein